MVVWPRMATSEVKSDPIIAAIARVRELDDPSFYFDGDRTLELRLMAPKLANALDALLEEYRVLVSTRENCDCPSCETIVRIEAMFTSQP